jgi:hypothetical protein
LTKSILIMKKQFGSRKGAEHGYVVLSGRSRVYCRVVDRGNSTIYLELAEPVPLPYAFQVSLDLGEHFRCEVKTQRGETVVGMIVGTSPMFSGKRASSAKDYTATASLDELGTWVGLRPMRGFKD